MEKEEFLKKLALLHQDAAFRCKIKEGEYRPDAERAYWRGKRDALNEVIEIVKEKINRVT